MNIDERALEDYICDHIEEFKKSLEVFGHKNLVFVGRQIVIGEENRADLLFYSERKGELSGTADREYVVVELKGREIELRDVAQVSRYMNALYYALAVDEEKNQKYAHRVYGVLAGTGVQKEAAQVIDASKGAIDYVEVEPSVSCHFTPQPAILYEEKAIKLDRRIDRLYAKEDENDPRI